MGSTTVSRASERGAIEPDAIYPLPVLMQRTGLGRKTVAKLRRQGMPVRRAGRNVFILGRDFIAATVGGKQ